MYELFFGSRIDLTCCHFTFSAESCSLEPFRNAIRIFKEWRVIEVDSENRLKLCDAYTSEDALFELIAKIGQFKL